MSWETVALGDVCELYQPKTISTKEMVDDGEYVVFGANGVIGRYDQYNHEEPQLLITCRGATCGAVNVSTPKAWINGNAMVVRPRGNDIDRRFLEYLFRGGVDLSKTITGAAQPQITRQTLAPLEISYPTSLPEQQRIVGKLDAAFAALAEAQANVERNRANARELFESSLRAALNLEYGNWEHRRLDSLLKDGRKISYGIVKPGTHDPNGVRLIKSQQVRDNEMDLSVDFRITKKLDAEYARTRIQGGEILLNIVGSIGRSAIAPPELKGANVSRAIAVIPVVHELAPWVQYNLRGFIGQELMRARTGGTAQPVLNLSEVKALPIPLVPAEMRNAIIAGLDSLAVETKQLETTYQQKLTELAGLKKAVLGAAFRGEL